MTSLRRSLFLLIIFLLSAGVEQSLHAQALAAEKSTKKAFAMSLLVPGLGHRYVHDGWNRSATFFGLLDASAWLGLLGAGWRERQLVDSYRALAATRAGAQIEGKDRLFFLNLGNYASTDEYVEGLLRARAWDRLSGTDDPAFQWTWATEADRSRYRELRSDAESMDRRTTLLVSVLVANRFLSALTALRSAQRHNGRIQTSLSLLQPPTATASPVARLVVRW